MTTHPEIKSRMNLERFPPRHGSNSNHLPQNTAHCSSSIQTSSRIQKKMAGLVKRMAPQRPPLQAATVRCFSLWSGSHPFARLEESASSRVPNSRRVSVFQPPSFLSPRPTSQPIRALSSATKPELSEEEVIEAVAKRMTNGKVQRVLFVTGAGLSADSGEDFPLRASEIEGAG